MVTSQALHEIVAAPQLGLTPIEGVLAGVAIGAVLTFVSALVLDGQRAKRDRASRFLDVRRVAYGHFLACCDSHIDALRSLMSARAALDEAQAGKEVAFGFLSEAMSESGSLVDALTHAHEAGEAIDIGSDAFHALMQDLPGAFRSDGRDSAARAIEELERYGAFVASLEGLTSEAERASEHANEGNRELRAIGIDIELVGSRLVRAEASKVLEAISGGSNSSDRFKATSSARALFSAAASEDISS